MTVRTNPERPWNIASVASALTAAGIKYTSTEIKCWPQDDKERELVRHIGRHCIVEEGAVTGE